MVVEEVEAMSRRCRGRGLDCRPECQIDKELSLARGIMLGVGLITCALQVDERDRKKCLRKWFLQGKDWVLGTGEGASQTFHGALRE